MLKNIQLDINSPELGCQSLLNAWKNDAVKVVVVELSDNVKDVRAFYQNLFPLLGSAAALAEDATISDRHSQRTGDIWMEIRYDPKIKDAYRHSSEAQPLHTDGSYIPGFPNSSLLCCVTNAGEGGETVFVEAKWVYEALKQEAPELLSFLLDFNIPHARSGDLRDSKVLYLDGNIWRVNWNYFCVDSRIDEEIKKKAEDFHQFLKDSSLIKSHLISVKLKPGQAVLWKDNEVLHGRNAFNATSESERFIWKCAFDVGNFK